MKVKAGQVYWNGPTGSQCRENYCHILDRYRKVLEAKFMLILKTKQGLGPHVHSSGDRQYGDKIKLAILPFLHRVIPLLFLHKRQWHRKEEFN